MLIFDSNVWIHAVTVGGRSKAILDQIITGNERAAVSPYICEEVRCNIDNDHSIDPRTRNLALERFFGAIFQCDFIDCPTQDQIERIELETVRGQAHNEVIGALGNIQPKDAPIFTHAYRFISHRPTIVTNDEEFSSLTPEDYGIPEISIRHLELTWKRVPTDSVD